MVKLDYDLSQTQENYTEITTYDDGCLRTETLVPITKDADSEKKCGFMSLADCLSIERALESSSLTKKQVKTANCAATDSTLTVENSVDQFLMTESKVVKTDSCVEKTMAEIERPKMIVCFEKEAYELVKDICVDNGVQSFEKVPSSKEKVDDPNLNTPYQDGEWPGSNVVPGFDNLNTFLMNEQSISDGHSDVSKQKLNETQKQKETEIDSEPAAAFLSDGRANDGCGNEDSLTTLHSSTDEFPELTNGNGITLCFSEDVNHHDLSKRESSTNEAHTRESSASSDDEPGTSDHSRNDDNSSDFPVSAMESGNVKEHGNEAPETKNEAEGTQDPQQHGHSRDANRDTSDGLTTEARNSLVHYGFADDSLFGQHSAPNSISFSGQIAYNGSTSLRSDSSTTSTRSFAFPILQSEWNSSPVKMAKADRKYYRRHRWRTGFLCCRF